MTLQISGFASPYVTASVCGNNALRGSSDCEMSASEGNELTDALVSRFTMPIAAPPTACPCVVRVVGADQAEIALVPFEVIGHPVGPLTEAPTLAGQVDAVVTAREQPSGFVDGLVASLGGDTTYEVTLVVRNRSPETLSAVLARGSAFDSDQNAVVSFDLGNAPPIAPGQTWTTSVLAVIPTPSFGSVEWAVDVIGAGPALVGSTTTQHRPVLLILLLAVAVLSLSVFVGRRLMRRHAERSEAQAAAAAAADAAADQVADDLASVG
ncbi:MAG: hypothetical protein WCP59_08020 [Actinomycetota bacterium]